MEEKRELSDEERTFLQRWKWSMYGAALVGALGGLKIGQILTRPLPPLMKGVVPPKPPGPLLRTLILIGASISTGMVGLGMALQIGLFQLRRKYGDEAIEAEARMAHELEHLREELQSGNDKGAERQVQRDFNGIFEERARKKTSP